MALNYFVSSLQSALRWEGQPTRPYVHPSQYRAPENVRLYSDGMHKLYEPSFITLAIAAVTLGLYVGIPHILLALIAFSWWRPAAITLALLLATLLLPAKPLRVNSVLSSYMFLCWRRYFMFSYLFEKSLDCYQDYVIAQFPHGAFPLGAVLGGTFMATEYPEYHCYATAASSAFWVPIWRHVHAWLGTESCTKTNFHHLLSLGVKGPLPHRHHSSSSKQQQEQEQQEQEQQEEEDVQLSSSTIKRTPFASAVGVAAAVSDDGVGAVSPLPKPQLSRRRSLEQLLASRQASHLSITASIRARFRRHHSLSDTESSDSEEDCKQRQQGTLRRLSTASDVSSTACTCCSTCAACTCGNQQQHQQQQPLHPHSSVPVRLSILSSGSSSTHSHRLIQQLRAAPTPAGAADALPLAPGAEQQAGCSWQVDASTGQRKTGVSVGLMVGGIAEMFMIRRDHERIKLKDRKGFVRVALEHGVPILPVYMFGANQVLDFGPPWLQRVSRRMRASVGMIYGAWGLPIPRRLPIFQATGKPMDVGPAMRKDHPDFAARVDELHAQFINEIERVYYAHRGKYGHGFENRPLVIS